MAASEPSPEGERSSSAVPEPESFDNISSPRPESNGEPMPEWTKAIETWGITWDIHLYGLGTVFLVLALLSLVCLLRLLVNKQGSSGRKVSVILLGFLALYGMARSVFLYVDAYHHKKTLPVSVLNIIWGIAQPCLTTSYTLLFVVLLNALRLKQGFRTWFTARNIALVTVPHFLFVFGAELIVSFFPEFKTLIFLCQLLYALFSLAIASLYTFLSIRLWKNFNKMKNNTLSDVSSKKKINRILYTCIVAATGGVLVGGAQLYVMIGPFSVFSSKAYVSAWPWYWFTTVMRLLEIYMATVLFSIAHHQSSKGFSGRTIRVASAEPKNAGQRWAMDRI